MSPELTTLLTNMYHLQAMTIVLTIGLYGLSIYAAIFMTRTLREIQRENREVLRRLDDQR